MKKGLLLIAHGSPRSEANDSFATLAGNIQKRTLDFFIQHAFLDSALPTIPDGIKLLSDKGIKEVIVLPYFLSEGKHTTDDIPKIIEEEKFNYLDISFKLKEPLGLSPEIANLILRLMNEE